MSVLLSADDLNDFISPGVACIKPVETLPVENVQNQPNPYEVTTEDKLPKVPPPPAQISLTDCLACSGCVTSAEAVLVSLQSHAEVQNALDAAPSLFSLDVDGEVEGTGERRIFVASVAPQVRASLAATYGTTEEEAGWMIEQLLSGPKGIRGGGKYGNSFGLVVDTNAMREVGLVFGAEEVLDWGSSPLQAIAKGENETGAKSLALSSRPEKRPILSSACPGWICYAEKTHPFILPHLSTVKSPQALTGTLLKTVLSRHFNIHPSQIFHLSIMPCFDKKLEASRQELTDMNWQPSDSSSALSNGDAMDTTSPRTPVRDVDCVITPRELLMLASSRKISFPSLPRTPVPPSISFPDPTISSFLFPHENTLKHPRKRTRLQSPVSGTSGGFLWHAIRTAQARHPGSAIVTTRGRNADVLTYSLLAPSTNSPTLNDSDKTETAPNPFDPKPLFQAARYYGFRNITNLVRKLQPPRPSRLASFASSYTSRTDRPTGKSSKPTLPKSMSGRTNGIRQQQPQQTPASNPSDNERGFDYIEVMACPGGCTNGGGQIRIEDLGELQGADTVSVGLGKDSNGDRISSDPITQKEWAALVDDKYFGSSARGSSVLPDYPPSKDDRVDAMDIDDTAQADGYAATDLIIDGINHSLVHRMVDRWAEITGIAIDILVKTTYRAVDSDVGKSRPKGEVAVKKGGGVEAVVGKEGGGW